MTAKSTPRQGLTLAELVVVLFVLTALAAVTVQSLGPSLQKSKVEVTKRTLENLRTAIVGNPSDSTLSSVCFVSEHGRLPTLSDGLLIDPIEMQRYLPQQVGGISPLLDGWQNPLAFIARENLGIGAFRIASLQPDLVVDGNPQLFIDVAADDAFAKEVRLNFKCSSPNGLEYKFDLLHSYEAESGFEYQTFIGGPKPITFNDTNEVSTSVPSQHNLVNGSETLPIGSWILRVTSKNVSDLTDTTSSKSYEKYFNLTSRATFLLEFSIPVISVPPVQTGGN